MEQLKNFFESIRNFFVNDLVGGVITFQNNGWFKAIVIIFAIGIGFAFLSTYIPRTVDWVKDNKMAFSSDKGTRYYHYVNKYATRKQSAKYRFNFYLIPTLLLTLFILAFLVSIGVIPIELKVIPVDVLFAISFTGSIGGIIAFIVMHFKFTFGEQPEVTMPTFKELLPPDYHTVTTNYYEKWDYETNWHDAGSSSYTYNANAEENFTRGLGNILSVILSIVMFLMYALFNYIDSVLYFVYFLISLPFRKMPLIKAKNLFYDDFKSSASDKRYTQCYRGGARFNMESGIPAIDFYFRAKVDKEHFSKAKEKIQSKKNNIFVAHQSEGNANTFYPQYLKKFIAEYKIDKDVCYLYNTHRGLVEYRIFDTPKKRESYGRGAYTDWVEETTVPLYLNKYDYDNMCKAPTHYYPSMRRAQYYYLKALKDGKTKENKKVLLMYLTASDIQTISVELKDVTLVDKEKSFVCENYKVKNYHKK